MTPFFVFSLPRSRSAWISAFLSGDGAFIGHDVGAECGSVGEFIGMMSNLAGTCETGAAFAWRLLRQVWPDARFAVVRRDPEDVCRSLARFGLDGFLPEMMARWAQLEEISALPGTLTVSFDDLRSFEACAELYEFCTRRRLSVDWWRGMEAQNIQVDMPVQLALLQQNAPRIAALKTEAMELMRGARSVH